MINHQRYVSLFLITVLFVSLLSFSTPQNDEVLEEIDLPKYASSAGDSPMEENESNFSVSQTHQDMHMCMQQ